MSYAKRTEVDSGKTRVEIERLLQKAGCDRVGVMTETGSGGSAATIYFTRGGWQVQMRIGLPLPKDAPRVRPYQALTEAQRSAWVEQRTRERWRQLLMVLKAKFVALEEGVETFEQSFMAHLVVGGEPIGQRLLPAIAAAQKTGGQLQLGAGQ